MSAHLGRLGQDFLGYFSYLAAFLFGSSDLQLRHVRVHGPGFWAPVMLSSVGLVILSLYFFLIIPFVYAMMRSQNPPQSLYYPLPVSAAIYWASLLNAGVEKLFFDPGEAPLAVAALIAVVIIGLTVRAIDQIHRCVPVTGEHT